MTKLTNNLAHVNETMFTYTLLFPVLLNVILSHSPVIKGEFSNPCLLLLFIILPVIYKQSKNSILIQFTSECP